jgi:molecular chaperone IbpA
MPFDKLFDELNKVATIGFTELSDFQQWKSYPPHNVFKTKTETGTEYTIELAVAGFAKNEIEVSKTGDYIYISGAPTDVSLENEVPRTVIHNGLAKRAFKLKFVVAKYVEVDTIKLENGLLTVTLKYELPDEEKTRIFEIL